MRLFFLRALALIFTSLLLLNSPPTVKASHFMGIDIRMECMNNCTTRVFWRAYRDCSGSPILSSNPVQFVPVNPACSVPSALNMWTNQITTEVTPVCPTVQTQCTNGQRKHGF